MEFFHYFVLKVRTLPCYLCGNGVKVSNRISVVSLVQFETKGYWYGYSTQFI